MPNGPFLHFVEDNFLEPSFYEEVDKAVKELTFTRKESDLFSFAQSVDFTSLSNEVIARLRNYFLSEEFLQFIEQKTRRKYKRGVVDVAGSLYKNTDFLLVHDDQLDTRTLAFLLYLEDFSEHEGGALRLYDSKNGKPTHITRSILPRKNRLACFEVSDISFHDVQEVVVDKQRFAVGGWLHADQ